MTKKNSENPEILICEIILPLEVDMIAYLLEGITEKFQEKGYYDLMMYGKGQSFELKGKKTKLLQEIEKNNFCVDLDSIKKTEKDNGFRAGQEDAFYEVIKKIQNNKDWTRDEILIYSENCHRGVVESFD